MARRRADGGSFAFELLPDDDDETFEEVPAEPSRAVRVAGALTAKVRAWPRRRVVAIGTALAVGVVGVAGTATVTSVARQRAWAHVMATAPGAVADLADVPVEAWRVKITTPMPIGLLGDVLVVQSSQWDSGEGPTLYGVDVTKGAVAWTTVAPHAADCSVGTPNPFLYTMTSRVPRGESVVCLSVDRRLVSVVGADGSVLATRELADAPSGQDGAVPPGQESAVPVGQESTVAGDDWTARRVLVTPDGGLLRLERLDGQAELPAVAQVEPTGSPEIDTYEPRRVTLLGPLVMPSLRVRLEDAATGDVRWETVLDGEGLPAGTRLDETSGCLQWGGTRGDELVVAPHGYANDVVDASTVWTASCGIDAQLDLATGEVLQRRDVFDGGYLTGFPPSLPLVDGGRADLLGGDREADEGRFTMRVRRDDGAVVGDVPGLVLSPLATDGPGSALLVTLDQDGSGVAAYDADDAALRWRSEAVRFGRVIARTADVVVVTDGQTVAGLDWESGATLWTHDLFGERDGADQGMGWYSVLDAVTDGERLAVVVPATPTAYADPTAGDKLTVALDLATGEVVWTTQDVQPIAQPIAGGLFRFEPGALVALQ